MCGRFTAWIECWPIPLKESIQAKEPMHPSPHTYKYIGLRMENIGKRLWGRKKRYWVECEEVKMIKTKERRKDGIADLSLQLQARSSQALQCKSNSSPVQLCTAAPPFIKGRDSPTPSRSPTGWNVDVKTYRKQLKYWGSTADLEKRNEERRGQLCCMKHIHSDMYSSQEDKRWLMKIFLISLKAENFSSSFLSTVDN